VAIDVDNQLPLSEWAKKLKGKDMLHPSEQTKTPKDPFPLPEQVGIETGVLAFLDWARKLKK
jgi:hypothetical protein